ncbi:MAG: micrococcal nuclease [Solirubrobacterales bacterium]|jgi:micrococcal nuclease|nr:micrococcal nuclease [Solirubrobacterales bacterium]
MAFHPQRCLALAAGLSAAVALGACGGAGPGRAQEPPPVASVRVVRAVDGDTIVVDLGGRHEYVRYIGVDTPETVKPGTPVQCFGPQAHDFNERLVQGRRVRLRLGVERRDRYGRLLAYVYSGRRFVNAELVRRGFARTLAIAPNDRFAERFDRLQAAAGRDGRGLWRAC